MSLTSTVEWGLSLPPAEALAALRSALSRWEATISTDTDRVLEASTPKSLGKNRRAAKWEITVEPLLEGCKLQISVEAKGGHGALLDQLGRLVQNWCTVDAQRFGGSKLLFPGAVALR